MADELEKLTAQMGTVAEGDGSGAYLAQLARVLVPGQEWALQHLLAMSRLSPKKAMSVAVLVNGHFRTTKKPLKYPKGAIDWWSMSDGPRIALLVSLVSISHGGAGRAEITTVLGGITRWVKGGRVRRLFGRNPDSDVVE